MSKGCCLLGGEFLDADVAVEEFGPFGLEADASFFEGDGFSVFVFLGEVEGLEDGFAIEDEGGFFAAVDADFHFVPFAFGLFDTEFGVDVFSGDFFAFGVEVVVFFGGVGFEVFAEDEEVSGVVAASISFAVGFVSGGFADLHFEAEGPDSGEVSVDVEEEAGVTIPIGAGGESFFEPFVFELEDEVAEFFFGVEAVATLF